MSKYTVELRFLLESGVDLGMQDYPIFDENYREQLNNKIFNHYYFDEIGFETVGRFKHYLNNTMNEIMPYYNQLLQSELLQINPLLSFERKKDMSKNVDTTMQEDLKNTLTKIHDNKTSQTINNNTSLDNTTESKTDETQNRVTDESQNTSINSTKDVNGNNSSSELDIFYDTPQGSLGDITTSSYATTANNKTGTNTIDEDETINSSEGIDRDENISTTIDSDTVNTTKTDTTSNTMNETNIDIDETNVSDSDNSKTSNVNEINVVMENGFEIPLSELVIKYRETFLNIDTMIIKDLENLFMMVY